MAANFKEIAQSSYTRHMSATYIHDLAQKLNAETESAEGKAMNTQALDANNETVIDIDEEGEYCKHKVNESHSLEANIETVIGIVEEGENSNQRSNEALPLELNKETVVGIEEDGEYCKQKANEAQSLEANTETVIGIVEEGEYSNQKSNEAQPLELNKKTVIGIEEDGEYCKQKGNEAQLLRDAIYTNHGLHSIGYSEYNRDAPPTYLHVDYGSRRDKNSIWVQFNAGRSGEEMDEDSRGPFIQLVFAILFICLLLTFIFAVCTFVVPGVRSFFAGPGFLLFFVGCGIVIAVSYKLMCYEYGRRPPCNFCGLFFAVVGECLMFGALTARYELREVLLALGVTCLVVMICFALAFTPLDFTKCYMFLIVIGAALSVFAVVVLVMTMVLRQRFLMIRLVLCCAFIIYHSFCLVMEIQFILGGKTVALGEDDYAVGAFMMYTSIMSMFFEIIRAIGLLDIISMDDLL